MANNPSDETPPSPPDDTSAAAELIRQKVDQAYSGAQAPDSRQELAESEAAAHRSKHQAFMHQLGTSGKDLATVQTEWHEYYQKLSAKEKHEVWQEFYASQADMAAHKPAVTPQAEAARKQPAARKGRPRNVKAIQDNIRDSVTAGGKLHAKHHLQSLLFGLGMGTLVLFIFLFGFFNEVLIAPFIQPSRTAAATPVIVGSNDVAATSGPEVIIPKINVQIPVNYTESSTDENTIENDLQSGVVHYPTTALPGQNGNTAFFGHSSNNIFNKGKYKFAFVLLHTLVNGDTFYLAYNGKMYVYQVVSRSIVDPSDVGVLNAVQGQTATATLITCDPPGTSLHRLVVVGKQISPNPGGNSAQTTAATPTAPTNLPSDGPTLWTRLLRTVIGKAIIWSAVVLAGYFGLRWVTKRFATA
jgi:LPXTG-site transpeptidase (sortase) family protein